MTTVKLYCIGAMARATVDGPITHGMVGVPVEVEWDAAWDGLLKTLKFRCAEVCRTAVVSEDGTAMIPYECLIAGQWLAIGLDGWDADGTLRIPSSWASCGVVKPSVAQCDGPEGAPPTVDTVAQLQILVGRAESAAGELSDAAAAAANSASDADKSAREAKEALDKTSEIAVNTPYIGANGNWIVWDAARDSYVDSGVRAVGNDANVTADNINKALGFKPVDEETVNQLKNYLADLAPAGAAVGQLFRVAAISEDGKYTMEPADMLDVQILGTSVVTDGVANIPLGNNNRYGLLMPISSYGLATWGDGKLGLVRTAEKDINSRISNDIKPVSLGSLDYAVKAAMCDGKGAAWTAEEQAAARERMGIPGDYELIETFTLQEDSAWERTKEPNGNDYNFTSVFIYRLYPSGGSIHGSVYSHLYFYDFSGRGLFADTGKTTDNGYNRTNISILERKGGISMVKYTKTANIGASSDFQIRSFKGYGLDDQFGNVCKIKSYDPSGCVINIYGVRA